MRVLLQESTSVKPDEWQDIKRLFHAALELSPEERPAFLREVCNGDEPVRQEVESLLLAHDQAGDFIVESALVEAGVVRRPENRRVRRRGRPRSRVGGRAKDRA